MLIAKHGDIECSSCCPALGNRHGLITGATGTGKTVTLQVLAERFSRIGVPVFMADVKGDLAGIAPAGHDVAQVQGAARQLLGVPEPAFAGCPVVFWDVFGEQGHPVRATVSDMGPLLLARILNLNETQEGVLDARVQDRRRQRPAAARPEGPARDAAARRRQRRDSSRPTTATCRRRRSAPSSAACCRLEQQGGDRFFGEPMLNIDDLLQTVDGGKGVVNILAADKLMQSPQALLDVAAVAAVRAVRAPARSRRPRQAEARVLLRRGAPAVHRRAARRCSRRSSRWCA